jgi:hypothetical protein
MGTERWQQMKKRLVHSPREPPAEPAAYVRRDIT